MAFLHENKEEFINAVNLASKRFGVLPIIAEKDYYVTMILRVLSERLDFIVFKGGTSLSKCYKAIKRFSEDIDLTSDKKLSQGQMRKLKDAIKSTADEIGLKIPNIDETRSRRNYNQYVIMDKMDADKIPSVYACDVSFYEIFSCEVLENHTLGNVKYPHDILYVKNVNYIREEAFYFDV